MIDWTSVNDRLPSESGKYLTYTIAGNCVAYQYSSVHERWNVFDSDSPANARRYSIGVTHWAPINKPKWEHW